MGDYLSADGGLKKTHSASSILSAAMTFHSASSTLSRPSDSKTSTKLETELLHRARTDSGFSDSAMADQSATKDRRPETHELSFHSAISRALPVPDSVPCSLPDREEAPSLPTHRPARMARQRSSTAVLPETTKTRKSSSRQSSVSRSGSYTSQGTTAPCPSYLHARRHRPLTLARSGSAISARNIVDDPYLTHQRAREIFHGFGAASASLQSSPNDHREPLLLSRDAASSTSHTQPVHPRSLASSYETLSPKTLEGSLVSHTPTAIIDWKTPASRRREYEKIDRCSRGFRGLWRKVTPAWLGGRNQTRFYKGKGDDAGSVRRYRLDLPEEQDEKGDSQVGEREVRPTLFTAKTSWSCFSGKSGKSKKES